MLSSKLIFKLFLTDPHALKPGEIVPVFHNLIQTKAIAEHLLIDVADYEHVPEGPGSVLVAQEVNIHLDHGQGKPGLMYVRKQPIAGDLVARIREVLRFTLDIAHRLEQHPALADKAKFRTDEMVFRINDRLHGPNNAATFDAVKPALEAVLSEAYPIADLTFEHRSDAMELFEIHVRSSTNPGTAAMLECLGFFPAIV